MPPLEGAFLRGIFAVLFKGRGSLKNVLPLLICRMTSLAGSHLFYFVPCDFHITPTLASLLHESGDSAELGVEQGCGPLPNLFGRLLT